MQDTIQMKLSQSEALVLFEFVSRFTGEEVLEIRDPAEERVLWDICATLESVLVEPFQKNYRELLEVARQDLVGNKETPKE